MFKIAIVVRVVDHKMIIGGMRLKDLVEGLLFFNLIICHYI